MRFIEITKEKIEEIKIKTNEEADGFYICKLKKA